MMQDKYEIDINSQENDITIESEIRIFLNKNKYVRRVALIQYLMKKHTHKIEPKSEDEDVWYSVDLGYSEPTINRRIKYLVKNNEVLLLNYKELSKLYIVNEEENAIGSYLVSKENFDLISEIKDHLENNVMEYFITGNSIEKRKALWEIESYEKRFDLTDKELIKVVQALKQESEGDDNEAINHFVQVIYTQLITKRRGVKYTSEFSDTFQLLLKKYTPPNSKTNKIREKILYILSYLGNEIVVNQMMEDAKNLKNLSEIEAGYYSPFAAKIIESKRTELFKLEIQLANDEKKEAEEFIYKIRINAKENLGLKPPLLINEFPEKLDELTKGEDAE